MKRIILIVLAILLFAFSAEARQVSVSLNWFYEAAKMPTGYTVDQAYSITKAVWIYQSNDMGATWVKIGAYPISQFPLPAPSNGYPIPFTIELVDGAQYNIHFSMTTINLEDKESIKSNWLSVPIDLRPSMPTVPPTIRVITVTVIVP